MGCSNGVQFTVPRVKAIAAGPLSGAQNSASAVPLAADDVIGDTAKSRVNEKAAPRWVSLFSLHTPTNIDMGLQYLTTHYSTSLF